MQKLILLIIYSTTLLFICCNCTKKEKWVNVIYNDEYVEISKNSILTNITTDYTFNSPYGDEIKTNDILDTKLNFKIIEKIEKSNELTIYILKNKNLKSWRILPITRRGNYLARINLHVFSNYYCDNYLKIDSILISNKQRIEQEGDMVYRKE